MYILLLFNKKILYLHLQIRLSSQNGYVTTGGASGTVSFSEEGGFKKCTITINNVGDETGSVGFEFANNNNGDRSQYGYTAVYFDH